MDAGTSRCGPEPEPAVRITLAQIYKEMKHDLCVLRSDVNEMKNSSHETRMNVHHLVTELERRTSEANAKVAALEARVKNLDEEHVRPLENHRNQELGVVAVITFFFTIIGACIFEALFKG
jgi:uncharacterized NAD-dependent epimerase/dehydratase family protein